MRNMELKKKKNNIVDSLVLELIKNGEIPEEYKKLAKEEIDLTMKSEVKRIVNNYVNLISSVLLAKN